MRLSIVSCLIMAFTLLVSCTNQIVYHAYHHFSKEGWATRDTIILNLHVTDSVASNSEILFLIRNQTNYPYQDFNATLIHNAPDTTLWRSFKLNFILADNEGRWNGSGWGGLYQSSLSLGEMYIHPGTYTFKVLHQMQDEWLKGVRDVGIVLVKSE